MIKYTKSMKAKEQLKSLAIGIAVYGAAILIYHFNPFYKGFIFTGTVDISSFPNFLQYILRPTFLILGGNSFSVILHFYVYYIAIGIFKILADDSKEPRQEVTRPEAFLSTLSKFYSKIKLFIKGASFNLTRPELTQYESTSTLYLVLKFLFIPYIFNAFFGNLKQFGYELGRVLSGQTLDQTPVVMYFYFSLALIFMIDTFIFLIGYSFEFKKSHVRSVDNNPFGWLVCLMCYGPFFTLTQQIFGWGTTEEVLFKGSFYIAFFLGLSILLNVIFVSASISLGLRASNLTNRGIVSWGPYRYVRHPAYATKLFMWSVMGLPIFNFHLGQFSIGFMKLPYLTANWTAVLAIVSWMGLYYLRALTEEKHLLKDPDYQAYCKKVTYRFIPGVY